MKTTTEIKDRKESSSPRRKSPKTTTTQGIGDGAGAATVSNVFEPSIVYNNNNNNLLDDGTASITSSWAPRRSTADAGDDEEAASASMTAGTGTITNSSTTEKAKRRHGRKNQSKDNKQRRGNNNDNTTTSLPERLGNTAISSTLGILKLAGDVTLSTTGNILSPSIEMTKNVLLPNLYCAISEYLNQISPQRLKDWFRIVRASVHHVITVIVGTERGSIFRNKIIRFGTDIVDVVSSDTSRQTLMDGMACFVKLNEALHTPEFKAFLEQVSVMGCRVVDAAAMGKNKKLIHDGLDLIWSGIELVNDPATTVALAEVAAYLCHALEMEDAAIHSISTEREEINRIAALKRKERDRYQTSTYLDSYLIRDPNATVEEVILSAFGVIQKSVEEANKGRTFGAGAGGGSEVDDEIPGSVVLGSEDGGESERPSRSVTPTPEASATQAEASAAKSGGTQLKDDYQDNIPKEEESSGIDNNDIDVNYLREKITKRAEDTKQEHIQTRRSLLPLSNDDRRAISAISDGLNDDDDDDGKKDIEELASIAQQGAETPRYKRNINSLHFEKSVDVDDQGDENAETNDNTQREQVPSIPFTSSTHQERSKPLEGETPVAHFYRVLDEVLTDERQKAAVKVLKRTGSSTFDEEGDNKELASGVLKRHVQEHRSEKRRSSARGPGVHPAVEKFIKENKMIVCGLVFGVLAFGLLFCAFGCYGVYMFLSPPPPTTMPVQMEATTTAGIPAAGGGGIHVPLVIHGNENEYVIRVVREVVHVNAQGETLRIERETKHTDEL